MRYMVIERFKPGRAADIYRRLAEKGRMMPATLHYVDSFITTDLSMCWQLMETDDLADFEPWTQAWGDLMEFQIVPVVSSKEARKVALGAE